MASRKTSEKPNGRAAALFRRRVCVWALVWAFVFAGPAKAFASLYYLAIADAKYTVARATSATIKQSVNFGSSGPYANSIRSIYVTNASITNVVETGWAWDKYRGYPIVYCVYVVNGNYNVRDYDQWTTPLFPKPTIGGSQNYKLYQRRSSDDPAGADWNSGHWRFSSNGSDIFDYHHPSFWKGYSALAEERNDRRDSPYGRWWSVQYQDPWGSWYWWQLPAPLANNDTGVLWRWLSKENDIETYRP